MQALSFCPTKCPVRCWLQNYTYSKESGLVMKDVSHFDVTYAMSAYD